MPGFAELERLGTKDTIEWETFEAQGNRGYCKIEFTLRGLPREDWILREKYNLSLPAPLGLVAKAHFMGWEHDGMTGLTKYEFHQYFERGFGGAGQGR